MLNKSICPEPIKLFIEIKLIHRKSNGSTGARTLANIATTRGFPLGCYRADRLMKTLELVSFQLAKHAYKKATIQHIEIPNLLNEQFAVTQPDHFGVAM